MGKAINLTALQKLAERTDERLDAVEASVEAIEVPTKISDLENDSGYQTAQQV